MSEKFTDEQILVALQCCAKEKFEACEKCAYYDTCKSGNYTQIFTDVLDLINRQKKKLDAMMDEGERSITRDAQHKYCHLCGNALVYTKTIDDYHNLKKAIGNEAIKQSALKVAAAIERYTYVKHDQYGIPVRALILPDGCDILDYAKKIIEEVTT